MKEFTWGRGLVAALTKCYRPDASNESPADPPVFEFARRDVDELWCLSSLRWCRISAQSRSLHIPSPCILHLNILPEGAILVIGDMTLFL